MAINVNEEGVMKPLTIDGAQTSGFTINGIELLFKGAFNPCNLKDAPNQGTKVELPRNKADYKYLIIITACKVDESTNTSDYLDGSIAVVDMEAFFDGATGREFNSDGRYYFHIYRVSNNVCTTMIKEYINGTDTNLYFCGYVTSKRKFYHTLFGVY